MHIAVMGSGAVGGYFGAKLAEAGHQVVFIARGAHLEAMRRAGLRILSPDGNRHIQTAAFVASAAEVSAVDLVLFCVKSYDTEAAAAALGPLIGAGTLILSLQNGVDNPTKLAGLWGGERILAGVAYVGAQLEAPGVIRHSSGGKIIFGPLDGAINTAVNGIERALSTAGITCAISGNIQNVQWAKLLWNAPFCAISALARVHTQQIVESETLTQLALDCMAEVRAAALVQGVELAAALFAETIAFSRGLGPFKPSMLQDLEAGKALEYEAFNGIVVQLLEQAGQPAPINRTFYALLRQLNENIRKEAGR
ncbi:MAG: ketopantoate reductase family protein [Chloroflexota bacterium]